MVKAHPISPLGSGEDESTGAYGDYSGLFHIIKQPRLNSLAGHMADSRTYLFKMGRRKLSIEPMHLPPEITRAQDTKGKTGPTTEPHSGLLCLPGGKTSIDF